MGPQDGVGPRGVGFGAAVSPQKGWTLGFELVLVGEAWKLHTGHGTPG